MGSAICTFDINDVQETFNGKFKEQATSSSAWLPVLSSKVPEPRPGQCVNNTQTLPDTGKYPFVGQMLYTFHCFKYLFLVI